MTAEDRLILMDTPSSKITDKAYELGGKAALRELLNKIQDCEYCDSCENRAAYCTNDCQYTNNELAAIVHMIEVMLNG